MDSVSQKCPLFADKAEQLQERGLNRKRSLLAISHHTTVPLTGEWLEAFWCQCCQQTQWYHVAKTGERTYSVSLAPRELWQQIPGVLQPAGNPTVSEFTRRQSRMVRFSNATDFGFVR